MREIYCMVSTFAYAGADRNGTSIEMTDGRKSCGDDTAREAGCVLAVDDEAMNLKIVARALSRYGFNVVCASDGEEALALAKQVQPDLILLDVNMPGMHGFDVCKALKSDRNLAPIPVIFLTAHGTTEHVVQGFEVGGVDYITKPFAMAELIARVRTHVQLHQLKRILPICSYCSKIRNESDNWERVEAYIHRQTGADFSHSICPDCYKQICSKYGLSGSVE